MKFIIPKLPQELSLTVNRLWNGDPCPDERVRAELALGAMPQGIRVRVESPILHEQKIPDAPIGSRVEGLWDYDVVELFLVGPGHRYVELELGAGGHVLLLSFDRIRHRCDAHELFQANLRYAKTAQKTWTSELILPWKFVPENLRALNAFMIASGQFLAMSPLPGDKPDFHQPDYYPHASL